MGRGPGLVRGGRQVATVGGGVVVSGASRPRVETPPGPAPEPARVHPGERAARWVWANRWPLTPLVVSASAGAGAAGPHAGASAVRLLLGAVVMVVWATWSSLAAGLMTQDGQGRVWRIAVRVCTPRRVRMSVRERVVASQGLAALAGWTWLISLTPPMPGIAEAALMGLAVGWPAHRWVMSRLGTRRAGPGVDWVGRWTERVTPAGSGVGVLSGSVVVPGSVSVSVAASVWDVRCTGHARDALGARSAAEFALGAPLDSVSLVAVRDGDTPDVVRVTVAAARVIETAPAVWPGPSVTGGRIALAADRDMSTITGPLWTGSGASHWLVVGATGGGKGGTTMIIASAAPLSGSGVLLYADGKSGQSAPALQDLATDLAVTPDEWGALIEGAFAVMIARQRRYGAAKIGDWSAEKTGDPLVQLLLDETNAITPAITTRQESMAQQIAAQGRSAGVSLIVVNQTVMADDLPGGTRTLANVSGGGTVVIHAVGRGGGARMAADGISSPGGEIALQDAVLDLPVGGGMAVIAEAQVLSSAQCRVFHALPQIEARIKAWAAGGGQPLRFDGADLAAWETAARTPGPVIRDEGALTVQAAEVETATESGAAAQTRWINTYLEGNRNATGNEILAAADKDATIKLPRSSMFKRLAEIRAKTEETQ
jgi:hypothetical protein